ncbi:MULTISPECIES: hypothetical protein [Edwardsiella]|uniref:Uncharacterized protein n=1 Tax=Edwardsiella anguillarum TaxID=1821960 RepID=A0ABY8SC77_9GAMM|nr:MULTISPECIES: hypothetical protein [Edwardsiella]AKM47029.1 hypothetical protein QY76_06490 [Edwardsiella sp. EA181011]GAJ67285.1 hypothetical protein MA13_contig00005-0065 [Edwardsiella piscicida]AKR78682.1 hypothetical protein AAZ33_14750 [Edwardsiella sp. LADL05-105]RFT04643.1 hypothetical protein CGL57_04840 [Edwardsiella anguillarum]UOU78532.1 hypothetical protein MUN71_16100 [Edwardsiella anguillarum]
MYKWIIPFLLIFNHAYAFTVDSLFKVDSENSRYFVLKNPDAESVYLSVSLTELQRTNKGVYQEIALSTDDFLSWPIYIDPMDIVIDASGEVRVSVIRTAQTTPLDRIIGVSFIPDSLRQQEQGANSNVAITIGYKSWYLIPGTQPLAGEPQAWISDKRIHFNNPTNKVLRLTLDVCPDSDKSTASEGCYSEAILLPGNEKQINVPMGADLNTGKVMFFDLSNQYKKEISLRSVR